MFTVPCLDLDVYVIRACKDQSREQEHDRIIDGIRLWSAGAERIPVVSSFAMRSLPGTQ